MFHNKEMKRYKTMIWLPATVELEFRLTAYSLDLSFYFVSILHIRPRPSSEGTELGQKNARFPSRLSGLIFILVCSLNQEHP